MHLPRLSNFRWWAFSAREIEGRAQALSATSIQQEISEGPPFVRLPLNTSFYFILGLMPTTLPPAFQLGGPHDNPLRLRSLSFIHVDRDHYSSFSPRPFTMHGIRSIRWLYPNDACILFPFPLPFQNVLSTYGGRFTIFSLVLKGFKFCPLRLLIRISQSTHNIPIPYAILASFQFRYIFCITSFATNICMTYVHQWRNERQEHPEKGFFTAVPNRKSPP